MGLSEDISKLKLVNVVVVGDAMLDRYIFGSVERISPEAPVPIFKYEREEFRPGGAANVAMKLVQLGAYVDLHCIASDDAACGKLHELLGPNVDFVAVGPHPTTTLKTRYVANGHQLLRVDKEDVEVRKDSLSVVSERVKATIKPWADAVVVSDYAKGVCSWKVLTSVLPVAQEKGIPVVIDPTGHDYSKYKCETAVLVPNEKEATKVVTIGGYTVGAKRILNITGAALVAVTCGSKGIEYFYPDGSFGHVPPHPVEVFDVTGAGDAVTAMFAVALASGLDYRQSVALANLAGGVVVTQLGTGTISKDMLLNAAKTQPENVRCEVAGEVIDDWRMNRENA